jgi:hypothetical protein
MKIPDPIIDPMTIIVESSNPSPCLNSRVASWFDIPQGLAKEEISASHLSVNAVMATVREVDDQAYDKPHNKADPGIKRQT